MTLKIFLIADVHSPDSFEMPELSTEEFDLVLTLGDIGPDTIDYILFRARNVPQLGVLGNHDPKEIPGMNNLHGKIVGFNGVKIGGFGGSPKYKDAPNHYEEKDVQKTLKKMGRVDIFMTHAPPLATSQGEDRTHRGFQAFDEYLHRVKPRYWFHGHLEKKYRQTVDSTEVMGVRGLQRLTLEF